MEFRTDRLKALVALLAVQLLFGTMPVAGKLALLGLSPFALAGIRVVLAGAVLTVLHRALIGQRLENRRDHFQMMVLAFFGVVVNQLLFIIGLSLTTAINAVVLITTIPVLTMLVAVVMGKEPARPLKILGIVLSMGGILVLLGIENLELRSEFFVGNLLVFLNSLSYAIFLVISKPVLKKYHPLTMAKWTFLYGAVAIVAFTAWSIVEVDWISVGAVSWGALAFIILGPSVGSYWLNNYALSHLKASTVALWIYLQPLVATVLAFLILDERLTERTVWAALLIFAGVGIATGRRRASRKMVADVPVPETKTFRDEEPGSPR